MQYNNVCTHNTIFFKYVSLLTCWNLKSNLNKHAHFAVCEQVRIKQVHGNY